MRPGVPKPRSIPYFLETPGISTGVNSASTGTAFSATSGKVLRNLSYSFRLTRSCSRFQFTIRTSYFASFVRSTFMKTPNRNTRAATIVRHHMSVAVRSVPRVPQNHLQPLFTLNLPTVKQSGGRMCAHHRRLSNVCASSATPAMICVMIIALPWRPSNEPDTSVTPRH